MRVSELDGEAVLLDLETAHYFGLNASGLRIWQLITEGRSFGEVLTTLLAEFEVPADSLESEVGQLLGDLESAGLVVRGECGE